MRLAEGSGTGLPKIRRSMAENGSPSPLFDFDEGRTYFRITQRKLGASPNQEPGA